MAAVMASGAGCSDDGGSSTLKIETAVPPAYLAVRDHGATEWQTLPVEGVASFEVEVAEEHEVTIVCLRPSNNGDSTSTVLNNYLRTRGDGDTLVNPCGSSDPMVTVSGSVRQAGQLLFGSSLRSSSVGRDFTIRVRPGTYDLLMLSLPQVGTRSAALRRDIEVSADLNLGVLDFSQDPMQPLVTKTFAASNAVAGEILDGTMGVHTAGLTSLVADFDGDSATVSLLPDELLLPADQQYVTFSATLPDSATQPHKITRWRTIDAKSDAAIALPEAPGPVVFENAATRFAATWTELPKNDRVSIILSTPGTGRAWGSEIRVSAKFIAATGVKAAELDTTTLPSFQSDWNPQPQFGQDLSLATTADGEFYDVGSASVRVQQHYAPPPTR